MSGPTNDIDALLLRFHPERTMGAFIDDVSCARYRAALTALVAERDGLRADLAAMRKQRDEARRDAERYRWLKSELKRILKKGGGA